MLGCYQDIGDLFGSDLPVEGAGEVRFAWRDGPFLKALKSGDWILLDEVCSFMLRSLKFSLVR